MELNSKFSSKKEIYLFLSHHCEASLPKPESTNVYFLKNIARGEKNYIKRSQVKVASIPQIYGLKVEDLIKYARYKPELLSYLPDERDWEHLHKKWLCDILYTLDTDHIQTMIDNALQRRKEHMEQSQNLILELRPQFFEAIQSSIAISTIITQKGRSAFIMKSNSKMKRTQEEINEVKQEEQLKKNKKTFLQNFKHLKEKNKELENKIEYSQLKEPPRLQNQKQQSYQHHLHHLQQLNKEKKEKIKNKKNQQYLKIKNTPSAMNYASMSTIFISLIDIFISG